MPESVADAPTTTSKVPRAVLVGMVFLLVAGVADQWLRSRRDKSELVAQGVETLNQLPTQWGEWQGEIVPMQDLIIEVAGCDAYQSIHFSNVRTGQSCYMSLMVGKPGPMSEHVPEVCMPAQGHTQVRDSFRYVSVADLTKGQLKGQLCQMNFVHPRSTQTRSVWHGWFQGRDWSRPTLARWTFASERVLFRMQVSADLVIDPLDSSKKIDPAESFLRDNLVQLTNVLAASPASAPAVPLDLPPSTTERKP